MQVDLIEPPWAPPADADVDHQRKLAEQFARDCFGAAVAAMPLLEPAELLTAHCMHECAAGARAFNFNLAGIKATRGWLADERPWFLAVSGECEPCRDGDTPSKLCPAGQCLRRRKMRWRAYDSLFHGVLGVLEVLQQARYRRSYELLFNGSQGYFRQLGRDGWYTADVDVYHRACMRRFAELKRALRSL